MSDQSPIIKSTGQIVLVLVFILVVVNIYTGAFLQEIGIPGVINFKFGQPHQPEEQQPPVISDLIPTPSGPQVDGTPITWNAVANDPNKDTIYYRFELNGPSTGKRYVVKQDWSKKSEWIWNSTDSDLGINYIRVSVRDEKHNEASGNATFIGNYSIVDRTMNEGEIGYSNIEKMVLDKTYTFSAYVARNDSINAARRRITTGTDTGERPVPALNNTLIDPDFWTDSKVFISKAKIMHPEIQVDLKGDTFEIYRLNNANQTIPVDRMGKNYGIWLWSVKPTGKGTHFLELTPYEVPTKTPLGGGSIRIEVIVEENVISPKFVPLSPIVNPVLEAFPGAGDSPVEEAAAVAEAAPEVEEAPAVEAEVVEEVVAEPAAAEHAAPANEPAPEAPGFESVFALTGLLAVAYLVLGRRESKNK